MSSSNLSPTADALGRFDLQQQIRVRIDKAGSIDAYVASRLSANPLLAILQVEAPVTGSSDGTGLAGSVAPRAPHSDCSFQQKFTKLLVALDKHQD